MLAIALAQPTGSFLLNCWPIRRIFFCHEYIATTAVVYLDNKRLRPVPISYRWQLFSTPQGRNHMILPDPLRHEILDKDFIRVNGKQIVIVMYFTVLDLFIEVLRIIQVRPDRSEEHTSELQSL